MGDVHFHLDIFLSKDNNILCSLCVALWGWMLNNYTFLSARIIIMRRSVIIISVVVVVIAIFMGIINIPSHPIKNEIVIHHPVTDAKSDNVKTITICALHDHSLNIALKILKDSNFEKDNNIKVDTVLLEYAPMERAHELHFSKNTGDYDIISIDQPSLGSYVSKKWIIPLDNYIMDHNLPSLDLDDIIPALRYACGTWDSKFYAVPLGCYGAMFAYRKDILAKVGLPVPKTFTDFRDAARKVNSPPELYGTALFAHNGEYITADSAPFLWSWGAGLINGCDVTINGMPKYRAAWATPEGIAALEFYASFFREHLTPPNTLEFDHLRYINAFQSGKVAMGIMPAEGIGSPMDDPECSKVVGQISYTTLPGKRNSDGTIGPPRPALGAHSLAISSKSKFPEEAYLVIQFLTSRKIGEEYIRRGGRPFRRSHFTEEATAMYPYMTELSKGMRTGRCRPNIPEYPAVSKIFYTAFHAALMHNAPIAEVMRAAAMKADREVLVPAYPLTKESVK